MSRLHPLIIRIRKGQRRLSNAQVMRLSPEQVVEYCDFLLTPEAALDVLTGCFAPYRRRINKPKK